MSVAVVIILQAEDWAFLCCNDSQVKVLSKLNILESAIKRKDAVAGIIQRGSLTQNLANIFGDVCCKAIEKVCQQKSLPWQVEVCSWGEDGERDKYTRLVCVILSQMFAMFLCLATFERLFVEGVIKWEYNEILYMKLKKSCEQDRES